MPTYRLVIEYDGTEFHGWQIQPGKPTVQEVLENALEVVLRTHPTVVGSGRTDAGVHARGQVAHFEFDKHIDTFRLRHSLNGLLPPSVAVIELAHVPDGFHARYDARLRRYRYFVCTVERALERHTRRLVRPEPDFNTMNMAAEKLVGTHDFSAFCRTRSETRNRVCTVYRAAWIPEKRAGDWYFEISADRFLHGMVRSIVGTLLQIGHGKRSAQEIESVLASRDRRRAGPAAPPGGLVLEEVLYDPTPSTADETSWQDVE